MAIHDSFYTKLFRDNARFHGLNNAQQQVEFIATSVPLAREHEILDLGCGFGRHSLELAKMGYRVTGLDKSDDYLSEARQAARDRNLKVRLVQADMRELNFQEAFDVVLSVSTSLAFYDEQTNAGIFRRVHAALRPGGAFFFDQGNIFWLVKNHVPESYVFDAGTCVISVRVSKETAAGRIEAGWDLRFYHLPELNSLLGGLGFQLAATFGEFDGSAYAYNSKRLITIWRKI